MPHQPYSPDLAQCGFSFFQNFLSSRRYKFRQALGSAISNASDVNLNQRTVMYFKNGFRDWNYFFLSAENTLMGCHFCFSLWIKCFWDFVQYTLHIQQPLYILSEQGLSKKIIFERQSKNKKTFNVFCWYLHNQRFIYIHSYIWFV